MKARTSRLLAVLTVLAVLVSVLPIGAAAASTDPVLTVTRTGLGTVTSSPAGIDCGTDCDQAYDGRNEMKCEWDPESKKYFCYPEWYPDDVSLTATAPAGWRFSGWGGACSGTTTCVVTMDQSKTVTATFVDVEAPVITSTSPTSGVYSGVVWLAATATDNHALKYVHFQLSRDGQPCLFCSSWFAAPYGGPIDISAIEDGPVTLQVWAVDMHRNSAGPVTTTFTIDNTAPTLAITGGPAAGSSSPDRDVAFGFSATDEHLRAVECSVDAGGFAPCSGGAVSHSITRLSPGTHTFTVRATDQAGNVTSASRTWKVTRMPTALSMGVRKTTSSIAGSGVLRENWSDYIAPLASKTVTVTLLKKKDGRFVKLAAKTSKTSAKGVYAASFNRPRRGTCKLRASYAGDAATRGTAKARTFDC